MDGSATLTTVMSRRSMNVAAEAAISVHHLHEALSTSRVTVSSAELRVNAGHRLLVAAAGPLPAALDPAAVGAERAGVHRGRALLAHPDRHRVAGDLAHVGERLAVVRVQTT